MGIDWGGMVTIFLAIILASLVEKQFLAKGQAVTQSNADVQVQDLSVDGYVKRHYSNAITV